MNGFNHLPNKVDNSTTIFYANANSASFGRSGSFQTWNKPMGASIVHFIVIGGGSGGGSGMCSSSAAGLCAGGGGGAPGGLISTAIPATLLPNTLYLQVGLGGAGGAAVSASGPTAGLSGSNGTISYVCLYPEINSGSVIIQSSGTEAIGGSGATNTAFVGVAGAVAAVADYNMLRYINLAQTPGATTPNIAQTAGGNASNSGTTSGVVSYVGLLTGGTGGGGCSGGTSGAAGAISLPTTAFLAPATVPGGAVTGGNGTQGFFRWKPLMATGGTGGAGAATNLTGVGGNGGKGAYGCGGGGGGAGRASSGRGGDGGDGLIIITVS